MKPLLTLVFLGSIFLNSFSQDWKLEWEKSSGFAKQDYFTDISELPDGGFVVLGECGASRSGNLWLIRYNQQGDTLWTRSFETPTSDTPAKVACLNNNDLLVLGSSASEGDTKVKLMRCDPDGNLLWEKTLDDGNYFKAGDIYPLENSGFILAGGKGSDAANPHLWLAQMDENGDPVWERSFSENINGCLVSAKQLPNSDFILSGQVNGTSANDCDIVLIRTNSNGEEIWQNRMEAPKSREWPECVCCSPDSCFVMVGWAGTCLNDMNDENAIFDYDLMIKKVNCDGKVIWSKNIDGEGSEGGSAITIRPDGKFLVAGTKVTSFTGKIGPWLLEVDNDGNIENQLMLNMHLDRASKVINSSDGGFVVIGPGLHDRISYRSDGWILKFSGM